MGTTTGIVETPYISLHREGMAFVQFQVLLLPYEGKEVPQVGITKLVTDKTDRAHRQNIGYEIAVLERKDIFLESGNSKEKASFGKYEFRGVVTHIRNAGKTQANYLLLDADYLAHNGKLLFSAPRVIKAIEFALKKSAGKDSLTLEITTKSDVSGIKIHSPDVTKVKVNNEEHKFKREGAYIIIK